MLIEGFRLSVGIRIVADFGSRIFQFTINIVADYTVHIYYYFGYYFYTSLLGKVSKSSFSTRFLIKK